MKVLVVLSILGLVAADPQVFLRYTSPVVTSTFTTQGSTPAINTYTASYPYTGFPSIQAALPSTYSYPFYSSPFVTVGGTPTGTTVLTSRQKRSADPEPEADPALVYTTGLTTPAVSGYQWTTLPATHNFGYSALPVTNNLGYRTLPAAVTVYSSPRTTTPLTYNTPLVSPYSAFPFVTPFAATTNPFITLKAAETAETPEGRTKRSAEPEADPQILTTGFTGFTYPAVNTRTAATAVTPTALTYSTFPRTTYPGWTNWPTTYTSGFPYTYGNFPVASTYIATA